MYDLAVSLSHEADVSRRRNQDGTGGRAVSSRITTLVLDNRKIGLRGEWHKSLGAWAGVLAGTVLGLMIAHACRK